MKSKINVYSEIGKLKTVLVHRPGKEMDHLTPDLLERLLFDEIPFMETAIKEHDKFTDELRKADVEVLYIEELVAQALDQNPQLIEEFVDQFIKEGKVEDKYVERLKKFLMEMSSLDMVKQMIAGVEKRELGVEQTMEDYPFVVDPLPNVLFQRDPFASIGNGITMNHMWSETRNRETIFPDFVFKHHERFAKQVPYFYNREDKKGTIEGGDILVLNKDTLIIGVSQRTSWEGIELAAPRIFESGTYKKIIVFVLPKTRSFMHLDTVFTNVDYDKFVAHPLIFDSLDKFEVYEIEPGKEKKLINKSIAEVLEYSIGKPVQIIKCGGEDPVAAAREQWSDGTNVLTIAPGKVIAYDRNPATIEQLRKAGVEVITFPSGELSRGRGGPRCMSMPLDRELLK